MVEAPEATMPSEDIKFSRNESSGCRDVSRVTCPLLSSVFGSPEGKMNKFEVKLKELDRYKTLERPQKLGQQKPNADGSAGEFKPGSETL